MNSVFQEKKYYPDKLKEIPQFFGVYGFYDRFENLLYIGKANNLQKRVFSYFHGHFRDKKTEALVHLIDHIRIITVQSEFEALLLEARLIRKYLPKYNLILRDDKHYIFIKITKEEFPRILLARKDEDKTSTYFGPFPSVWLVRDILRSIRRIIPYCTQSRRNKKKCFYFHLKLCDPCPGGLRNTERNYQAEKIRYKKNIRLFRLILEGRYKIVQHNLKKIMSLLSRQQKYEEAAKYRDKLIHLNTLLTDYHLPQNYLRDPYFAGRNSQTESEELRNLLIRENVPLRNLIRIECYDISHIRGKSAVGSMVVFENGMPVKSQYRRFRIKFKNQFDDFAMLSEVLERRLTHKEWTLPDLFIIDGGKPQLIAVAKIFKERGIDIPYIGIAKEFEELIIPVCSSFKKLRVPYSSDSLHLVQRIRDEAHRFAHRYYEKLRLRSLLGDS